MCIRDRFPIDSKTRDYNAQMQSKFDDLLAENGLPFKLRDIFPKVLVAGEDAGKLTEEGAKLLDPSGNLEAGIPLCPPEGDAGTGMVATNAVKPRTGNVSAGTSVFAMIVLEKELSRPYDEIDLVKMCIRDRSCVYGRTSSVGGGRAPLRLRLYAACYTSRTFRILCREISRSDFDGCAFRKRVSLSG